VESPASSITAGEQLPPAPRRHLPGSLAWALAVPSASALAGWLAQYPYGMIFVGVGVALATLSVAAIVAGHAWHRAGAATIAAFGGLALVFFAGPALYQLYMETLGTPVPAMVTKVENRHNRHGADLFCTVAETTGDHAAHEISEQENPQRPVHAPGARDPAHRSPRVAGPAPPPEAGRHGSQTTVGISVGLFVLTGAAMGYAGLRRR
jgi:hypothetical protein